MKYKLLILVFTIIAFSGCKKDNTNDFRSGYYADIYLNNQFIGFPAQDNTLNSTLLSWCFNKKGCDSMYLYYQFKLTYTSDTNSFSIYLFHNFYNSDIIFEKDSSYDYAYPTIASFQNVFKTNNWYYLDSVPVNVFITLNEPQVIYMGFQSSGREYRSFWYGRNYSNDVINSSKNKNYFRIINSIYLDKYSTQLQIEFKSVLTNIKNDTTYFSGKVSAIIRLNRYSNIFF